MNKKSIYKFSKNTFSLFSIKAIELGLTIWLIPYLILVVKMENYGIYAYAMALIIFFQNVLNYCFNLSTVRELSQNKHSKKIVNKIFNQVISVKLFLLAILLTISFLLIAFIPEFREQKLLYIFASFILIGDFFSLRWFFLGIEEMKYMAIINLLKTTLYVVLVLILVTSEEDYIYIPLAESIAFIFISFVSFLIVLKAYKIKFALISFDEIFEYLKLNFSSFINLLLPSTFGTILIFIVGVFGQSIHVGYTQIGVKVASAFSTINSILTMVFYPIVNRNKSAIKISRRMLLSVGTLLGLAMFFGSEFLISNWLKIDSKTELLRTINIVKILSPIPFLMAIISSYGINGLLVYYKDALYSKITIISVLSMIVSCYFLMPFYPFLGGAISLLLSRILYSILSYIFYKKI